MPVDFLTDEQAASYGRFVGPPSQAELERFFFLDDADRRLVGKRRGLANVLGFGVQLGTVRCLGTFLSDPVDVPTVVLDYVAGQLAIGDPSCLKAYPARAKTRLEHQWEIAEAFGYRDFASAEAELSGWIADRAWTSGEGLPPLFVGAVAWLRERRVLLPGVSVLTRCVASVRDATTQRLWDTLAAKPSPAQAGQLDRLLDVPAGRLSDLERLRDGPTATSGKGLARALERVAEVGALGFAGMAIDDVPRRRLVELARWGMAAKASALRRHPYQRRLATLLATVVYLEAKAVDDALELFDVLMANELLGKAVRASNRANARRYPKVARDAAACAAAVGVLLDSESDAELTIEGLWQAIDEVVPRSELLAAVANLTATLPPPDADPAGEWRAELIERYATVRSFVPQLCRTIEFGATAEAARTLDALRQLPELLEARATKRAPAGWLDAARIASDVVPPGWWRQLVFPPDRPEGTAHRAAYVFCVLEQLHQHLRRRDAYAAASSRWADPRAKLLSGSAWEAARGPALNALQLPDDPDDLLAEDARALDDTWRQVASALGERGQFSVDADGRLHARAIEAVPDPPSLTDLRRRCEAMLPRVDVGELVLEVISWHPGFLEAFTAVSGGEPRLADLRVTIAAALTANALNVGYTPVISPGVAALTRGRISHVDQNYLRAETYAAANGPLIEAQADIELAQAWGGGLVAAVDGIRFVVPVRSVDARPNPKYFGRRRGATWLNLLNDQAVGLAGMVVSGSPRDSLHLIDLIYRQEAGRQPEVIVGDTGTYSDMVFGLLRLLGREYRPQLADLPDAKLWRIDVAADYGPLDAAARGRIDLGRVRRHWPDLCRLVASVHTGAVSAHDVIRMLSPGGRSTQLGEALAHYGRISKTMHVLAYVDDEAYRRQSRGSATSRRAATAWPAMSSTAAGASCASTTARAWRTSWAPSAWS